MTVDVNSGFAIFYGFMCHERHKIGSQFCSRFAKDEYTQKWSVQSEFIKLHNPVLNILDF